MHPAIYVCILYKPGPELYISDWLCHNSNTENRDQEITGMNVNILTTGTPADIPVCTPIQDVRAPKMFTKMFVCFMADVITM